MKIDSYANLIIPPFFFKLVLLTVVQLEIFTSPRQSEALASLGRAALGARIRFTFVGLR